jgi:hypothetical protein
MSGGFGLGPYGFVNAGSVLATAAEEDRSNLSSSRKFDFPTGRYVANDEGGFEPMDDVAQAVCLAVAFAKRTTRFITARDNRAREMAIRTELRRMTKRPEPLIELRAVTVTAAGGGRTVEQITYRNLRTGTVQTVTP